MYTHVMPITSTNTFSLSTIQHIDIDCSAIRGEAELSDLINWVRSVPRRSAIHVRLRFATGSPSGRKVRHMFQSLGCTVNMTTDFSRI
jgi:hypothetical protein